MKIAYFTYHPWEAEYLRESTLAARDDVVFDIFDQPLSADTIPENAAEYDAISIFVNSAVPAEVMDAFENCKLIAIRSTGFDHVDCEECRARDIRVANVPRYGENTVAEYAFALMLSVTRRLTEGYDRLREDGQFNPRGLEGIDLKGKTLGVVGTGTIGKHVIKIASGFGMHIIAHDPYPDEEYAKQMAYTYHELDQVLAKSDIVTLHVPYNESTHHLINEDRLERMKDGAYLVNTSRGGVIDTQAFVRALQSGKLAGAGLDVLEEETILDDEMRFFMENNKMDYSVKDALANYILIDMPNVVVTPHIAFNTREAVRRIVDTTLKNLEAFADGEPVNIVNNE